MKPTTIDVFYNILDLRIMFFNMFYHLHVFVRNGTPYQREISAKTKEKHYIQSV